MNAAAEETDESEQCDNEENDDDELLAVNPYLRLQAARMQM